jgi:hypothetical protein
MTDLSETAALDQAVKPRYLDGGTIASDSPALAIAAHAARTSYQHALTAAGVSGPTAAAVPNAFAVLAGQLGAAGIDVAAAAVGLVQAGTVTTVDEPGGSQS